jgi:hypothetical protein
MPIKHLKPPSKSAIIPLLAIAGNITNNGNIAVKNYFIAKSVGRVAKRLPNKAVPCNSAKIFSRAHKKTG